jgi:hypothetical protein
LKLTFCVKFEVGKFPEVASKSDRKPRNENYDNFIYFSTFLPPLPPHI